MRKYKICASLYNGAVDLVIEVPDEMRFIFKDGSVGNCLKDGHNHYLGIARKEFSNDKYDIIIGDYMLRKFDNIKFYDEVPLISSDELTHLLSKYYIYKYINSFYDDGKQYPKRLYECAKIIKVDGPYDIEISRVTIASWLRYNTKPVNLMMTDMTNCGYLLNYHDDYSTTEISEDQTNYINSIKQVMDNMQIPWME